MPDGRVHASASLVSGAIFTYATLPFVPFYGSVGLATGFATTMFVNPDLDLNTRFPRRKPWKWLWWVYWYPYSRFMKHRSVGSHFPVISTLIRVAYLTLPFLFLMFVLDIEWWYDGNIFSFIVFAVIGMIASDTIHAVMDVVTTGFKRRTRWFR